MVLKELRIKNFRGYYGETVFTFSKGLTLIIGGNGDGKTTFFEALEWLFNTTIADTRESNVSAMRKAELEIGESDEVSVVLIFEHYGDKELEKSFIFEKIGKDNFRSRNFRFDGYETVGPERKRLDGAILLERCFDSFIRKYSLFKGESELNVFDNEAALKTLVNKFSGIKYFDELVDLTESFENKSLNAVNRELKNDQKVSRRALELDNKLAELNDNISSYNKEIIQKGTALNDYTVKLENLERYQDTSEAYQNIKDRIKVLSEERARLYSHTVCDYSINLLDDYWLLRPFPKVLNEFQEKVSNLSRKKRTLEKQEIERLAREEGQREAFEHVQKLANDAVPLPWNLPDKDTMQEMIDEEICKVCGRVAKKGSDAHNFMVNKLQEYLRNINVEATSKLQKASEVEPLFPNSYIDELETKRIQVSGNIEKEVTNIANIISERLEFISKRKNDLDRVIEEINKAEEEKNRLLIQSPGVTEELLEKNFSDWKGFIETKSHTEHRLKELTSIVKDLETEKKGVQEELNALEPSNETTKILQKVHTAFEYIMKAFVNAKETNIINFLRTLEQEANDYFKLLNKNDFHGVIKITRMASGAARINLYSNDDNKIESPGGAQRTTMYMSVLFAVSKITTLKREQDYPLIFDAPTSSFEVYKEDVFYNVIDTIDKQCIIVTKDLLLTDTETGEKNLNCDKINQLTCSVYRIQKAPGFDPENISTLKINTEKIK